MKRALTIALALFALFLSALNLQRCARVIAPQGGPRDTIPPHVVRTVPPILTKNFTGQQFRLYFNEYPVIKDPQKQIVFSPPLQYPFTALMKGKSIEVSFSDTLRENTTYSIFFGESIADLTEGNRLSNYRYTLSTGEKIDSCHLNGHLRDAWLHEPIEDASIMIYRNNVDSFPKSILPDFVARTNTNGDFDLQYIPQGLYKIFALKDENANLLYDMPKELIAYQSPLVQSQCNIPNDSTTQHDSIQTILLNAFQFEKKKQLLITRKRPAPDRIVLGFSTNPQGQISTKILNHPNTPLIPEHSINGDTISYWIMDSLTAQQDTLRVAVEYLATDSLNKLVPRYDTIALSYKLDNRKSENNKKSSLFGLGNKEQQPAKQVTKDPIFKIWFTHPRSSALLPNDTVLIKMNRPPIHTNLQQVQLLQLPDSTSVQYRINDIPLRPLEYQLVAQWKPNTNYLLLALPSTFFGLGQTTNDSVSMAIQTANPANYAQIHFNLHDVPFPCIIQLFTPSKDKKTEYAVAIQSPLDTVTISYIKPGSYSVRIVHDINGDGSWTTGNYDANLQPEPVRYFIDEKGNREIKVRENWEYDIPIHYNQIEK